MSALLSAANSNTPTGDAALRTTYHRMDGVPELVGAIDGPSVDVVELQCA